MTGKAFVTGGTGFLGSHFLINMLGTHFEHAFVLVRGKTFDECKQKLIGALEVAAGSYLSPRPLADVMKMITIVRGDIEHELCGVDIGRDGLTPRCAQTFWHFAASLNFEEYQREKISALNVDGTANAVDLANQLCVDRFFYVSTAYTCGIKEKDIPELLHDVSGPFSNYYEESKCIAEHMVTSQCERHGLGLVILRPSVVIGNSQTKKTGGSTTGLYGFIREMKRLSNVLRDRIEEVRLFGNPDVRVNYIPIDLLMSDLGYVIDDTPVNGAVYHLTSTYGATVRQILNIICTQLKITNLVAEKRTPELSASPIENLLAKRMTFYGSYISSQKNFVRCIPLSHTVSEFDIQGYVVEAVKELSNTSSTKIFSLLQMQMSDGCILNVYTSGLPSKPPVVIINAFGMPVDVLAPLASQLRDSYFVVTWEARFLPSMHGTILNMSCGVDRHVQDLDEIRAHFDLKKFTLIGWCTGARIALRAGEAMPGAVEKLVLLNGAYHFPEATKTTYEVSMETVMPQIASAPENAKIFFDAVFTRHAKRNQQAQEDVVGQTNSILTSTDPELIHLISIPFRTVDNLLRYATLVANFVREPVSQLELQAKQPALIMTGSCDVTAHPDGSIRLSKMLENSRLFMLEGGDHFSIYKHNEYTKCIADYISEETVL